ncbi:MAG: hypothetical protein SGI89_06485 [bacterium]|nr:hypothetical protein [bacterium]
MPKLILNIETGFHSVNELEGYYKLLDSMRNDLKKEESPEYLKLSYLLFCAATLEYSLNSLYIESIFLKYSKEIFKDITESFVGLSFKKKFQMAPIIISNNRLMFKKDHQIINTIFELIDKRNKILHNKSYFRQLNMESDGTFRIEKENLVTLIDKQKCLKYGEALTTLNIDFFTPARTNSLIEKEFLIML